MLNNDKRHMEVTFPLSHLAERGVGDEIRRARGKMTVGPAS